MKLIFVGVEDQLGALDHPLLLIFVTNGPGIEEW